jgi:uncharacterized protein (TIGR03067 family)
MLCVLSALAVGFLVAADEKGDAKKDMDGLQGEWTLVSAERNGEKLPDDQGKTMRRIIKGDEFSVTRDGETLAKGKFKIDPTKKPKTIDVTLESGDNILGIYELEGDEFKMCYGQPGGERPKAFASKADNNTSLLVWKRAKK